MISKLNTIRAHSGLRKLSRSSGLARAANAKSAAMAATGNFSHGPVRSRVRRYVRARAIGETLAWVPRSQRRPARTVVRMWMRSPSHRATLLSPAFRRVGVARRSGRGAMFFTLDLASAR